MPVRIASYQTGGSPEGFDFQPQLTSEPTAPEGGGTDGQGLRTDFDPAQRDRHVACRSNRHRSLKPIVRWELNAGLTGFRFRAGFGGGVVVASGDVNGDNSALGDPITFTYTVTNTSSAYEGTHALYQDVFIPPLETDVRKGEWITDVTYQSVELLGQPTETIWMTYEHIEY